MSWEDSLEMASYKGVEFNTLSVEDEFARRTAQYKYPYRNGADIEDLGREPRPTRLTAVFFGNNYESELGAMLKVIDEDDSGTFVHPVFGSWKAKCQKGSVKHVPDMRNYATVELDFIEDGTSTALPDLFSVSKLEDDVNSEADDVDKYNKDNIAEASDASNSARDFASRAKAAASELNKDLNTVRKKIDNAVTKSRRMSDIQSYPLVRSLKRLNYSCQTLTERIQSLRPPMVTKQVKSTAPLGFIAHGLYKDRKREGEIKKINKVRNPFLIKRDTELKVYAR